MRASAALPLVIVLIGAGVAGCGRSHTPRIHGGGATFIEPLMNTWQSVYYQEAGVQVDYTGTGSGNGIQQMIKGAIRFGCTDAPLDEEQLRAARAARGEVLHIPLALGGVVPIYNVPGTPEDRPLRFSGPVLADIFLGDITRWDDPALRELNPGIALPAVPIRVVSRSDPSGTTAVFAEFLAGARPEKWTAKKMGQGTAVSFAVGVRAPKSPGVAGEVSRYAGAISYVELTYAKLMKEKVGLGAVRNRDGHFVIASPASVSAAAESLHAIPEDLTFSLVDAAGHDSYPISGADWAVFYREQPAGPGELLVDFLRWATARDRGQAYAAELGYAPLPDRLIARIDDRLRQVEFQ
jgi:phosphate transport system substrate-binding protein